MTELAAVDERTDGPESRLPLIEELTTGVQETRMKDAIAARLESGERLVSPGYLSNIISVIVDGNHAQVQDCSLDQGVLYSRADEPIATAAERYKVRTIFLVHVDGEWVIEDAFAGGDEECDPNAV